MRNAYDARSSIAHGSEPSKAKLKFKGNAVTLQDFCGILTEIVRAGLVKAINYAERKSVSDFKPDWDGMRLR